MSSSVTWHKRTLEELICLTSGASLTELTERYEKKPNRVQLLVKKQSASATLEQDGLIGPPGARAGDDLNSYILLRWCPWFSRTFGALSDANLYMLTVRLLRLDSEQAPILLELLSAVCLVLKQPNVPYIPTCRDPAGADRFLFSDC